MRRLLALLLLLCVTVVDSAGQVTVLDRFGRPLQSRALRLVDWEGHLANPAVPFQVSIPEEWRPATVEIAGSSSRLQFADRRVTRSEPATIDDSGPKLTLQIQPGQEPDPVYISIWPDRDTRNEAYSIWIGVHTAANGLKSMVLPIVVEDQDQNRPLEFDITIETSRDATSFYTNPTVLAETRQAADDWAYFLTDQDTDEIIRGASRTWIWDSDGFLSGYWVTNDEAYRGFLLYAWGMRNNNLYSGGAASGAYQTRGGWPIDIMSAGHIAMEIRGNRNLLGWAFYGSEQDWWRNDNHPRGMADFRSHVLHQIGHALFFSSGHDKWREMKSLGGSTARSILRYLGGPAVIDRYDHIYDSGNQKFVVDPSSRRGAFGSEYASGEGVMAPRRWIITKTDLLMAQAVGYDLRDTTPFHDLTLPTQVDLISGSTGYKATTVTGGVPDYLVEVVGGALPAGLEVDQWTGEIRGFPASGDAVVRLRATDQMGDVVEQDVTVRTASVVGLAETESPVSTKLEAFPNPVSQASVLRFEIEQAGWVALGVFDLQGRRVASVVDRLLPAGKHEFAWNAEILPSGVYLARLAGPRTVETQALTVVR